MPYRLNVVKWQQAERDLKMVRERVFVFERHIPYDVEFDKQDRVADHVLVIDDESREPVAAGRITPNGEISRICVVKSRRKSPIGRQVIEELINIAKKNNVDEVFINSSLDAVEYFARHNFQPIGNVFMEAGRPLQKMTCTLNNINFKRFYLSH